MNELVINTRSTVSSIDLILSTFSPSLPVLMAYLDDLTVSNRDLGALVDDLTRKITLTQQLRAAMKEQMDVSNRLRNTMIAILVAIYVPLSFTTVSL